MTAAGQTSRLLRTRESSIHDELKEGEACHSSDVPSPSVDEARCILSKILSSPEFSSVIQLRAFLAYIVTAAIENRPDEIKGYTIAVEALGRDTSFNPVSDPIVRVEAARLRKRLSTYYAGTGNDDPVIIEIPKGSYAPIFVYRASVGEDGDLRLDVASPASGAQEHRVQSMPAVTLNTCEKSPPVDGIGPHFSLNPSQLNRRPQDDVELTGTPHEWPRQLASPASLFAMAWSSPLLLLSVAAVSFSAGILIGTF